MLFKVGTKVRVTADNVLPGGGGFQKYLENPNGPWEVAGWDGEKCYLICFGKEAGPSQNFGYADNELQGKIDKRYLGKNNRYWWVFRTELEAVGMIDNLKESSKNITKAFGHGMAVGAATEGADFAYTMACNYLHNQFGIPLDKLNDHVNKELITAAAVAILHLSAGVLSNSIPGMEKVQSGCELVIEGKAKEHTQALLTTFGPMLMHMSGLMDPDKAMERLTKKMQDSLENQGFNAPSVRVEMPERHKIVPEFMELDSESSEEESVKLKTIQV